MLMCLTAARSSGRCATWCQTLTKPALVFNHRLLMIHQGGSAERERDKEVTWSRLYQMHHLIHVMRFDSRAQQNFHVFIGRSRHAPQISTCAASQQSHTENILRLMSFLSVHRFPFGFRCCCCCFKSDSCKGGRRGKAPEPI